MPRRRAFRDGYLMNSQQPGGGPDSARERSGTLDRPPCNLLDTFQLASGPRVQPNPRRPSRLPFAAEFGDAGHPAPRTSPYLPVTPPGPDSPPERAHRSPGPAAWIFRSSPGRLPCDESSDLPGDGLGAPPSGAGPVVGGGRRAMRGDPCRTPRAPDRERPRRFGPRGGGVRGALLPVQSDCARFLLDGDLPPPARFGPAPVCRHRAELTLPSWVKARCLCAWPAPRAGPVRRIQRL
jgi:hypothetical protein